MAMHEQILRKEQDPFHKPEGQKESAAEQAAAAGHRRVDAEEQRATESERTKLEQLAPSVVAHLPGQTGASDEAVKHLFTHFAERANQDRLAEEAQRTSATQTDPRTTARAREPRGKWHKEAGDEFKEGFAADFMPDSQLAAPAIDEGPRGPSDSAAVDAGAGAEPWDGAGSPRRRKRGAARGTAKKSTKGEGK